MEKSKLLEDLIHAFAQEVADSKEARTIIETLIKIFRNIQQNPNEIKYQHIKINNSSFYKNVWRYNSGRKFMLLAGWRLDENNELIFRNTESPSKILDILINNRLVTPQQDEWTGSVIEGLSRLQLRERELKNKATEERKKELAEFFKNKEEQKKIAEWAKAEHAADRQRTKVLKSVAKAEHAADRQRTKVLKSVEVATPLETESRIQISRTKED